MVTAEKSSRASAAAGTVSKMKTKRTKVAFSPEEKAALAARARWLKQHLTTITIAQCVTQRMQTRCQHAPQPATSAEGQ